MMDPRKVQIGIAPIGWTNDDLPELGGDIPFEQCVSEMALAGYSGCEVGGKFPRNTEKLNHALAIRNLRICNAWFSSYLTTAPLEENLRNFEDHCRFLHAVGARVVGISEQGGSIQGLTDTPVHTAKPIFSGTDWNRLFKGIEAYAETARKFNIQLTYHHHMGTGIQTIAETRCLLEGTRPEQLKLLFDSGHFAFGGEDPLAALREFIPRTGHIHLKDIRESVRQRSQRENMSFLAAVKAGVFTVPGDGDIDFAPLFREIAESGYAGWMVVEAEQDPASANPFEFALNGRRYIRELTGI